MWLTGCHLPQPPTALYLQISGICDTEKSLRNSSEGVIIKTPGGVRLIVSYREIGRRKHVRRRMHAAEHHGRRSIKNKVGGCTRHRLTPGTTRPFVTLAVEIDFAKCVPLSLDVHIFQGLVQLKNRAVHRHVALPHR